MNIQNAGVNFPKGLSYAFTRFSNGFSRQIDRIEPDRKTDVRDGSTIRFKINPNTKFGLRSLSMYYKFTVPQFGQCVNGAANNANEFVNRYHPRYSSSIIKNISIKMNQYSVDNVEEYGLLYNTLVDMNMSTDQISKRFLENIDPSVKYEDTYLNDELVNNIIYTNSVTAQNKSDTNRIFVINNFLNLLGSSSVEYLDTNDIGTFEIELVLNPANICFRSGTPGVNIDRLQALQYTLNDIYMTYERINFEDPLYDQIKQAKIMSEEGLEFAWTSYSTKVGPVQNRSINFSFTENASSLDSIICTTRRADYNNADGFLLQDGYEIIAQPSTHQLGLADTGVNCFNQSRYFQRDLATLTNSQIYVNGTAMYKQPQTPEEIFNENMIVLNGNTDTTHNIHGGCNSIHAFLQYYFTKILSLHYNKEYQNYLISGLNGGGSSFNITWITNANQNAQTINVGQNQVQPIVFCQKSQVLKIMPGKQIAILP